MASLQLEVEDDEDEEGPAVFRSCPQHTCFFSEEAPGHRSDAAQCATNELEDVTRGCVRREAWETREVVEAARVRLCPPTVPTIAFTAADEDEEEDQRCR